MSNVFAEIGQTDINIFAVARPFVKDMDTESVPKIVDSSLFVDAANPQNTLEFTVGGTFTYSGSFES